MKKYILGTSLGASGVATVLGISAVIYQHSITLSAGNGDAAFAALGRVSELYQLAGIFGLLGIAAFFVGWVFPASVTETHAIGDGGATSTRNVVNN